MPQAFFPKTQWSKSYTWCAHPPDTVRAPTVSPPCPHPRRWLPGARILNTENSAVCRGDSFAAGVIIGRHGGGETNPPQLKNTEYAHKASDTARHAGARLSPAAALLHGVWFRNTRALLRNRCCCGWGQSRSGVTCSVRCFVRIFGILQLRRIRRTAAVSAYYYTGHERIPLANGTILSIENSRPRQPRPREGARWGHGGGTDSIRRMRPPSVAF